MREGKNSHSLTQAPNTAVKPCPFPFCPPNTLSSTLDPEQFPATRTHLAHQPESSWLELHNCPGWATGPSPAGFTCSHWAAHANLQFPQARSSTRERKRGGGAYIYLYSKKQASCDGVGTNMRGLHALGTALAAVHIFSHLTFPKSLEIIINPTFDVEREAHRG